MAENWEAVRSEVADALGELSLVVTLHKAAAQDNPWSPSVAGASAVFRALDKGIKTRYDKIATGELIPRTVRVVTLEALPELVPEVGDEIEIKGKRHIIRAATQVAPSTVTLLYRLELAAEPIPAGGP